MTPDDALAKQIELYRGMTCEQRLKIALDLHAFVCNVSRAGIRRRYPEASENEVDEHLRERIKLGQE